MDFSLDKINKLNGGNFIKKHISFPLNEGIIEQQGDVTYLIFIEHGVDCVINSKGEMYSMIFHSDGHEDYKGYKNELPHDLKFQQDQKSVQNQLRSPSKSIPAIPLIEAPYSEIFDFDDHNFSVFYSPKKRSIQYCQITILGK